MANIGLLCNAFPIYYDPYLFIRKMQTSIPLIFLYLSELTLGKRYFKILRRYFKLEQAYVSIVQIHMLVHIKLNPVSLVKILMISSYKSEQSNKTLK